MSRDRWPKIMDILQRRCRRRNYRSKLNQFRFFFRLCEKGILLEVEAWLHALGL